MAVHVPFHIVLVEPVIPQNTGSIARLCACTGARLHLIHPLGFRTDDSSVKRAGLDYWQHVSICEYRDWQDFVDNEKPLHMFFFSKLGKKLYWEAPYASPVYLVFGSETHGLSKKLWRDYEGHFYQIPIRTEIVRSLNLAQCAAIGLYEAIRRISANSPQPHSNDTDRRMKLL